MLHREIFRQQRRIINFTWRNIPSVASHYQYRGIFRQQRHTVNITEYLVYNVAQKIFENFSGVALSMLHRVKFRLSYRVNTLISRNILQMALNAEYCIQHYQYGGIFRQWRHTTNIASYNILTIDIRSRKISKVA